MRKFNKQRSMVFKHTPIGLIDTEYTQHHGEVVLVGRKESDDPLMYHITAKDGWHGIAYASELKLKPKKRIKS